VEGKFDQFSKLQMREDRGGDRGDSDRRDRKGWLQRLPERWRSVERYIENEEVCGSGDWSPVDGKEGEVRTTLQEYELQEPYPALCTHIQS
jgi:hypothetical protein